MSTNSSSEIRQGSSLASSLPPDVLIEICTMNTFQPWEAYVGTSRWCTHSLQATNLDWNPDYVRDTTNASHVCRWWRTVILSTPGLWKHMIDPYDPFWSNLMLERSKSLGISFSLSKTRWMLGRSGTDLGQEVIPKFQERLTAYQIFYDGSSDEEGWKDIRDSMNRCHLLNLKTLSIILPRLPWAKSALPPCFPGPATPSLKQLHLANCLIYDKHQFSPIGQTLTHLVIDGVYGNQDNILEYCADMAVRVDTVEVLRTLPRLQTLYLVKALEFPNKWSGVQYRPLVFEELREFRLSNDMSPYVVEFLRCLRFPNPLSSFSLEVTFPFNNVDPDTQDVFLDLSESVLSKMTPFTVVEFDYSTGLTCSNSPPHAQRLFHTRLITSYYGPIFFLSWLSFIKRLYLRTFPGTSHAHRLSVHNVTQDLKEDALKILGRHGQVRVLGHVNAVVWNLLLERGIPEDDVTTCRDRACIPPELKEISFDITHISMEDPGAQTGAKCISRIKKVKEPKVPDVLNVHDLIKFCQRHKSIQVVRFPDISEEELEKLKRYMQPLSVEVRK
ncbi:hypothetical protein P691DRAFT_803040 [Macrolepiota fuliginosa MF-IS2]|uniref:F-box domain-containing protein n=1 Tax=Macrolepiota fuliginosa MF-IS2 TaxID=1400762 RepID=A0A9P5X8Z1_9AGAR|nr:hypothetical protein P691DRAFT_803040 [Macrolepiota fuliginosa MF-IS2]